MFVLAIRRFLFRAHPDGLKRTLGDTMNPHRSQKGSRQARGMPFPGDCDPLHRVGTQILSVILRAFRDESAGAQGPSNVEEQGDPETLTRPPKPAPAYQRGHRYVPFGSAILVILEWNEDLETATGRRADFCNMFPSFCNLYPSSSLKPELFVPYLINKNQMITGYLSNAIVKGGVSPVFDNPSDYGLEYEDVTFTASDGVSLSGWLVKGGSDKVIIQSHYGVQSSRSGYTPEGKGIGKMWQENISFLKHVKFLVSKGYSVLMYDFRNHGESQAGTCPWVTWGPEESKDVVAAVEYISSHPEYKDAQIGLLSICMGAASSTYAFGERNGLNRFPNIKAMVAIQPLRYPDFIAALGLNNFIGRSVTKLNNKRTGIEMDKVSFMPDVKKISVPTLLVQNSNDEYLNKESIEEYYSELAVKKDLMWLDLGKKRAAGYDYLTRNPEKILSWFDSFIQ